jgi:hypothetical protein
VKLVINRNSESSFPTQTKKIEGSVTREKDKDRIRNRTKGEIENG